MVSSSAECSVHCTVHCVVYIALHYSSAADPRCHPVQCAVLSVQCSVLYCTVQSLSAADPWCHPNPRHQTRASYYPYYGLTLTPPLPKFLYLVMQPKPKSQNRRFQISCCPAADKISENDNIEDEGEMHCNGTIITCSGRTREELASSK